MRSDLMNKPFVSLLSAAMLAGFSASALAQPDLSFQGANGPDGALVPPVGSVVLYDQTAGEQGLGVTSQNFEAAFNAFDNHAADDFQVTDNDGWAVTSVFAGGVYFNGPGPVNSVNIWFYGDFGGQPGGTLCEYLAVPVTTDNGGSLQVDLP
ncbi:MAG: hypothetical protein R3330_19170, partial [Saprospiraceae bacterium]|nr:hypothetical protein [Saprospiraceae bacterium]